MSNSTDNILRDIASSLKEISRTLKDRLPGKVSLQTGSSYLTENSQDPGGYAGRVYTSAPVVLDWTDDRPKIEGMAAVWQLPNGLIQMRLTFHADQTAHILEDLNVLEPKKFELNVIQP